MSLSIRPIVVFWEWIDGWDFGSQMSRFHAIVYLSNVCALGLSYMFMGTKGAH